MYTSYTETCQHNQDGTPCIECREIDAALTWYQAVNKRTQHIKNEDVRTKMQFRTLIETNRMLVHHQHRAHS